MSDVWMRSESHLKSTRLRGLTYSIFLTIYMKESSATVKAYKGCIPNKNIKHLANNYIQYYFTVFCSVPMPSTVTSMISPAFKKRGG
jgi:hypothetical protein